MPAYHHPAGNRPIIDLHLDLGLNALEANRELRWPHERIRRRELGQTDRPDRARSTVCFPEMRRGNLGVCVATLLARTGGFNHRIPAWSSPAHAWAQTQGMLQWYREMEAVGELRQLRNRRELDAHWQLWSAGSGFVDPAAVSRPDLNAPPRPPIGYVLSLEGADSLVTLSHLDRNYAEGLRAVGPAHYGPGVYAHGTDDPGLLPAVGRDLLREMDRLQLILDVTHLSDGCFWDALELYRGPVWASHHNCRQLANWNRQLADDQIRALAERGALIGLAFDAIMLVPGWHHLKSRPQDFNLTMERIVEHADHICQLTGTAKHLALGTDLDGAFGIEQTPLDLDSIADLQKLPALFAAKGYSEADIDGILHGHALGFLRRHLPA